MIFFSKPNVFRQINFIPLFTCKEHIYMFYYFNIFKQFNQLYVLHLYYLLLIKNLIKIRYPNWKQSNFCYLTFNFTTCNIFLNNLVTQNDYFQVFLNTIFFVNFYLLFYKLISVIFLEITFMLCNLYLM